MRREIGACLFPVALLLIPTFAVLTGPGTLAQDSSDSPPLPTYRSRVSEVRITFFVTGANNRPLTELTESDFAVVDSGKIVRHFRSLVRTQARAQDVVVLLDLSESAEKGFQVAVRNVLQLVAPTTPVAFENLAVLSFGGSVKGSRHRGPELQPFVLCSGDCRASDAVIKLQTAEGGSATPLFDSLVFAADFINHRRNDSDGSAHTIVILLSDGEDNYSLRSGDEALHAIQEAAVVVYAIDLHDFRRRHLRTETPGTLFLRRVSELTGGQYFSPSFEKDNGQSAISAVLADLGASYVVTYDLPSYDWGFHSVYLMPTHNPNLTFHTASGYSYEPEGH